MTEWPGEQMEGHDTPTLPWVMPGEVEPHRRRLVTRHPLSARFHAILEEIGRLHDKKQADYGTPEDPFANVRAQGDWGLPAWVGVMMRAGDKMKRLQKVARGGKLENESVQDSFKDLAVYTIIALVMWEEVNRAKYAVGIESKPEDRQFPLPKGASKWDAVQLP